MVILLGGAAWRHMKCERAACERAHAASGLGEDRVGRAAVEIEVLQYAEQPDRDQPRNLTYSDSAPLDLLFAR